MFHLFPNVLVTRINKWYKRPVIKQPCILVFRDDQG